MLEMRLSHLARPPRLRIVQAELGNFSGENTTVRSSCAANLDRLLEVRARRSPGHDALDRVRVAL